MTPWRTGLRNTRYLRVPYVCYWFTFIVIPVLLRFNVFLCNFYSDQNYFSECIKEKLEAVISSEHIRKSSYFIGCHHRLETLLLKLTVLICNRAQLVIVRNKNWNPCIFLACLNYYIHRSNIFHYKIRSMLPLKT